MRKVIAVRYDADGNMIEGDFKDGIIGEAGTFAQALELVKAQGFALVDFESPENVPGELIDEALDAFAVGVISA